MSEVYGDAEMQEKCEGLWENIAEVQKWLPMIVLLQQAKSATDIAQLLATAVQIAGFALTALGKDPQSIRPYRFLALIASLVRTNPEVRAEVEKLLKG
jgi:hypothetical protein